MPREDDIASVKHSPTVFVIFGATGDLSGKKIFPSFFELHKNNLLPEKFRIIATARKKLTKEEFIKNLKQTVKVESDDAWQKFASQIEYISTDIDEGKNLNDLKKALLDFEEKAGVCTQRILYMAISPFIYKNAFVNLGKSGLNLGCQNHGKKARIVVEKPFGHDQESALDLNEILNKYFDEEHIYRIDHFLGKETVQNIFAFRFANELFEPIWNNKYIDHVQITAAEDLGVEKRGEYYDKTGALRDFVQNHLLQLLTLVAMDQPQKFEHDSIRTKKLEIVKNITQMTPDEILKSTVRGQYEGYTMEEKIDPASQTETYALVKLHIDSKRWQGVPFYLRTGKKLMGKVSSIIVSFKEKGHVLFENFWERPMPNHVTLQIQPNEGIGIRLVAKKPGLTTVLEPVDMEFCYRTSFDTPQPDAYERLLMDIIIGDQTLFIGQVGESWRIIDPVRRVWDSGKPKLSVYKPGTWGPKEADELIEKDKRIWLAPYLSICKI